MNSGSLRPGAPGPVEPAAKPGPVGVPPTASLGHDRTQTAAPGQVPNARPAQGGPNGLGAGDVLANRYRIQRLLGKGGMGAVYLAHDEVLGDVVALKLISSAWAADEAAMMDRFKREAAAGEIARCGSPLLEGVARLEARGWNRT